jgi:hypothetical protein
VDAAFSIQIKQTMSKLTGNFQTIDSDENCLKVPSQFSPCLLYLSFNRLKYQRHSAFDTGPARIETSLRQSRIIFGYLAILSQ